MIGQVKNSGVEVKLGWGGDSVDIKNADPDVVILATGATPILPSIRGSELSHVVTSFGVLLSQEEIGNRVLIVGGGMVGLETAEFLTTMGKQVTVFEMLDEVGRDGIPVIREAIRQRLNKVGVNMHTKTEVLEITAEGVRVKCEDETAFFEGDSVVLAGGMKPNNEIKEELKKVTEEIYAVGDCAEPRTIRRAIEEGFRVGYAI
jgi:pyruvate/2-oxoglutarate dehydrogenase complex dihydrolipoamide dehydrogenase (E3) component